ncbi:hypothetical protein DRO58_03990 [Candidatus Bathyarchaeota archaeon]|nr:MAG: hypothetical protein DRO58_03990 [Candidatus Bathyarchaeota archaeon]
MNPSIVKALKDIVAFTSQIDRDAMEIAIRLLNGRRVDNLLEDIVDMARLIRVAAEDLMSLTGG